MLAARAIDGPYVFGVDKSVLGCNVDTPSSLFTACRQRFYGTSLGPCDLDPFCKGTLYFPLRPTQAGRSIAFQTLKSELPGEVVTFPGPCERRFACSRLPTINSSVHCGKHTNRKPEATEYSSPSLIGHRGKGCCFNLRIRGRHREVTCSAKKAGGGERPKDEDNHKKSAGAPRVSTNINIPLRYQLRYVKALKDYRKDGGGPPVRQATGYRKKKEKTSESNGGVTGDVVAPSTSLMGQGVMEELNLEPPVLLVDGYNMCGYWPKLKKHFAKGDLETARSKLVVDLQTYGACKGIKVVVVFDAQKSGLQSHSEGDKYLEVVYSADDTADTWIEREAKTLHEKGNHNVWVVTSDLAQQSMAYGLGATVWSCGLLIQEINQARREMLKQLEEDRMIGELSTRQPTFEESVTRESFDKLASLYEQLSRGARTPEDPFGHNSDVSSEEEFSDDDDGTSGYDSDGALADAERLSEWARAGGGGEETDDDLNAQDASHSVNSSGNDHSHGSFSVERELQGERLASNGLAGPSAQLEKGDENERHEDRMGSARPSVSPSEAIPVAFGKGRVNLGAAVKKRRQLGEGYSSGSDTEGAPPKRSGTSLRDPARDLEIFQRFDTLPDFGYSTGEEDHRGRLHRRWRDVERGAENGAKKRGVVKNGEALRGKAVDGKGQGNGGSTLLTGPSSKRGVGANGASEGRNGLANGMRSSQNGIASGENGTASSQNGALLGSRPASSVGGVDKSVDGRSENGAGMQTEREGNGMQRGLEDQLAGGPQTERERTNTALGETGLKAGDAGTKETVAPLVIRSSTKRVPGQSPRVAKPKHKESKALGVAQSVDEFDSKEERVEGQASRSKESALNLLAPPESIRSSLFEPNGASGGRKSGRVVGARVVEGKPNGTKRLVPPSAQRLEPRDDFEQSLYQDLESIPFEELTTEQLLALKYGHTSKSSGAERGRRRSDNASSPFSKLQKKRREGR